MIKLALVLFALATRASGFTVKLVAGNKEKPQVIEPYLDFAFDEILISASSIDCKPQNDCRVKDAQQRQGKYHDTAYVFTEATLAVHVPYNAEQRVDTLDIDVRLTDMSFGVLGLNPISALRYNLKGKPQLQIEAYKKELSFVENMRGHPLAVYQSSSLLAYYINALLTYELADIFERKTTSCMPARICLHDKDVTANQNYFFMSDKRFITDWEYQLDKIYSNSMYLITSKILPEDGSHTFAFTYDYQLFDSYDGEPMKPFAQRQYRHCDLFIGDFGVHRATLRVILGYDERQDGLQVSIMASNQPYIKAHMWFKWASIMIVVSTLGYLGYLCLDKMSAQEIGSRDQRTGFYRSLNR